MPEDPEEHPDAHLLERFMRCEIAGDELRRVVRHLLAGCARCGAVTRRLWQLGESLPKSRFQEPELTVSERPGQFDGRGALLPDEAEPELLAAALHRQARALNEEGCGEEALTALRQARRLYDLLGDTRNLARLRHLEGRIAESLGEAGTAETAFLEARRSFIGEGMGSEAAAVLLDLAMLYTRAGRGDEVRPYAEDLLPILRDPDLRQGVGAALLFVRRLVETGHAGLEVLTEVARYVNDAPAEREAPALLNSAR
jgi:tetratricopeptide (TPR) repeat protein